MPLVVVSTMVRPPAALNSIASSTAVSSSTSVRLSRLRKGSYLTHARLSRVTGWNASPRSEADSGSWNTTEEVEQQVLVGRGRPQRLRRDRAEHSLDHAAHRRPSFGGRPNAKLARRPCQGSVRRTTPITICRVNPEPEVPLSTSKIVTGSHLIGRALQMEGVTNVFALAGDHVLPVMDVMADHGLPVHRHAA